MDENPELIALQERLDEARAEIERLQLVAADREAQNVELREALAAAQQEVQHQAAESETLRTQLAALQAEAGALREMVTTAQEQVRLAAAKYREAVLAASPELPAELVTGDSVEEIEAALARVRQIVTRIREHLEAKAQAAAHVPAGAPPRSVPDFSDLTPQEKIIFGLRRDSQ